VSALIAEMNMETATVRRIAGTVPECRDERHRKNTDSSTSVIAMIGA
jgi:hypothetical protein